MKKRKKKKKKNIVFIAGGLAFFALTAGYTALCDRL